MKHLVNSKGSAMSLGFILNVNKINNAAMKYTYVLI